MAAVVSMSAVSDVGYDPTRVETHLPGEDVSRMLERYRQDHLIGLALGFRLTVDDGQAFGGQQALRLPVLEARRFLASRRFAETPRHGFDVGAVLSIVDLEVRPPDVFHDVLIDKDVARFADRMTSRVRGFFDVRVDQAQTGALVRMPTVTGGHLMGSVTVDGHQAEVLKGFASNDIAFVVVVGHDLSGIDQIGRHDDAPQALAGSHLAQDVKDGIEAVAAARDSIFQLGVGHASTGGSGPHRRIGLDLVGSLKLFGLVESIWRRLAEYLDGHLTISFR